LLLLRYLISLKYDADQNTVYKFRSCPEEYIWTVCYGVSFYNDIQDNFLCYSENMFKLIKNTLCVCVCVCVWNVKFIGIEVGACVIATAH
jgi:hypothetical protein